MKSYLPLCILMLVTFSCANNEGKKVGYDDAKETSIIGKWKLQKLQKKSGASKRIKEQPTEVVLSIMDGGYFVIYDTFIDPKFSQKGFNRISEISKGQWEFIDNSKLVLHHNYEDSSRLETLIVTLLNNNTLITKGENKKANIYKTYEGY